MEHTAEWFFEQHVHTHVFDQGERPEGRRAWLAEVEATCREAGVRFMVREVESEGRSAYEFGFAEQSHYAAFILNVFGDLEEPGSHVHTGRRAAKMHLRELGIRYRCEEQGDEVSFVFDRFSDRLLFQTLLAQGVIEASARGLQNAHSLQGALDCLRNSSLANHPIPEP